METHCRIARVRLKASPHLTVHTLAEHDVRPIFMRDVSIVREQAFTGYAIVAWGRGLTTALYNEGPHHDADLPGMARDALLRHQMISHGSE